MYWAAARPNLITQMKTIRTCQQSDGSSVLCLLIFAAIVLLVSSVFIYQIARLFRRMDGGRVPPSTNAVENIELPQTNSVRAWAVALSWEYQWIDFPQADAKTEQAARTEAMIGIRADESGNISVAAYRAGALSSYALSNLMQLDADGIPITWSRPEEVFVGTPVHVERSENLANWIDAGTVYLQGTNEVMFYGRQGFYRTRR